MIFIATGSRSFQFNRLLKAVDEAIDNKEIVDVVFAQVGSSDYIPRNYETVDFLDHQQFNNTLERCDIVITHGGTGVIVNSIKMGKKVIAVPRLKKYNEVVDDHQIQLIREFEEMGMITACYDSSDIGLTVSAAKKRGEVSYESNTKAIIGSLREFIEKI